MDDDTVILWENALYPDETVRVSLPLGSTIDPGEVKQELGIPDTVDTGYFPIERTLITLWACRNCHSLWSDLKHPVNILLFGGGAVKFHCPSANQEGSILNRKLHDIDFMVDRKSYRNFKEVILRLNERFGNRYLHFMTPFDRRFTGLRGGRRILTHAIHDLEKDGTPQVGVIDVLVDSIEMRHTVDVRSDMKQVSAYPFSIRLHNLLVSKSQMIFDVGHDEVNMEEEGYRVLNDIYPYFSGRRVLMGMEKKDLLDVCAILLDHDFGDGSEQIDLEMLQKVLNKDKKLRLTVRLNLENLQRQLPELLVGQPEMQEAIGMKLTRLIIALPKSSEKWSRPWWNTSVDVPAVG